jgi:hypothetical protein
MLRSQFLEDGRWLRGNTHTHTTRSDGKVTIEERIAMYEKGGYDFLAITDHNKTYDPKQYQTEMTLIGAIEFHPQNPLSRTGDWHFIALGVAHDHEEALNTEISAQVLINRFKEKGAYIIICHPYWCGFDRTELSHIKGADAVEVYNHVCEQMVGKGDSTIIYDTLLQGENKYAAISSDDSHGQEDSCFGGWIKVKAKDNSAESIMDAIKNNSFFSSTGPDIFDVTYNDEKISVTCSEARSITFVSRAQRGKQFRAESGAPLTSAEWELKTAQNYVRVQIEDYEGRKAWSQPVFIN